MLSNSVISKSFSIWKTRSAYYINFIIASYFKNLLLEDLKSSKYIVVFSDETLNEKTDILARFFNETTELLETRYFDSTFLKIPIALIFYRTLLNLSHLFVSFKCIEVSLDVSIVNLDVLKQQHQYRVEKEHTMIANIGSCGCGLHILHGSPPAVWFKQSNSPLHSCDYLNKKIRWKLTWRLTKAIVEMKCDTEQTMKLE